MPEGHTIHRLALDHRKLFVGVTLSASSPQGRAAALAKAIDQRTLRAVEAHGKHLFYEFDDGIVVHIHLGLFGSMVPRRLTTPPSTQIRLRLAGRAKCVDLRAPTACELLDAFERARLVGRLGPDLLRPDADADASWGRIKASRRRIGELLLDQSIVSGVGNVYRAEGLFQAGIHPEVRGHDLDYNEFLDLWQTLRRMLADGVRDRRIVTTAHGGERTRCGERTWVYGQRKCVRCGTGVHRWKMGARTAYACPVCQKPKSPID